MKSKGGYLILQLCNSKLVGKNKLTKTMWTDINNLKFKYGIRNAYISKDINKLRSQGVAI